MRIFDSESIFFIGKEKAESFTRYVINNYVGRLYVYTTEPNASVGLNVDGEGIPVTEVISNGYEP